MAPDPRRDAQQRTNQIRAFRRELDVLRDEGMSPLTPEQEAALASYHDRLLARYRRDFDVDWSATAGRLSRGLQAASLIGGLAIVAGLTTLVVRVWGSWSLPAQVTLLTVTPLLALFGVQAAAVREPTRHVAGAIALGTWAVAWASIVLTVRVLDLPFSVVLLWPGVAFGVALATSHGFRLIWTLSLATAVVAFASLFFASGGVPWTMVFERLEPLALAGFGLAVLSRHLDPAGPGFGSVARSTGWLIGLGAVLALASVRGSSLLAAPPATALYVYQALMLVASVAVLAVSLRRDDLVSVVLATVLLAVFLLDRYVDWLWDRLPLWAFFLVLAAVALGAIRLMRRWRDRLGPA